MNELDDRVFVDDTSQYFIKILSLDRCVNDIFEELTYFVFYGADFQGFKRCFSQMKT